VEEQEQKEEAGPSELGMTDKGKSERQKAKSRFFALRRSE
jgi:hypothetical protein